MPQTHRTPINRANAERQVEHWWTEVRVNLLERRWREGALVFDIAAEIGCTRNAIIGKARRLKLGPAKLNSIRISERIANSAKIGWSKDDGHRSRRVSFVQKQSWAAEHERRSEAIRLGKRKKKVRLRRLNPVSRETKSARVPT